MFRELVANTAGETIIEWIEYAALAIEVLAVVLIAISIFLWRSTLLLPRVVQAGGTRNAIKN